jgi:hypothetical protein
MADNEWETHKAEIERLYIDEDKTLKEVAKYMASKGFHKS